jgi:hypothetical protein
MPSDTAPAAPPTADQLKSYFNEALDDAKRATSHHHHLELLKAAFVAGRVTFT